MHGHGTFLNDAVSSGSITIFLTLYWGSSKRNIGSKTLLCQNNIQTLKEGNYVLELCVVTKKKDKAKTFVKDNVKHVSVFGEEFIQLGFDR